MLLPIIMQKTEAEAHFKRLMIGIFIVHSFTVTTDNTNSKRVNTFKL